jgi:hypothetical protein
MENWEKRICTCNKQFLPHDVHFANCPVFEVHKSIATAREEALRPKLYFTHQEKTVEIPLAQEKDFQEAYEFARSEGYKTAQQQTRAEDIAAIEKAIPHHEFCDLSEHDRSCIKEITEDKFGDAIISTLKSLQEKSSQ